MKKILLLMSVFLPQFAKQAVYRRFLRWRMGRKVHIGLSFVDAIHVDLGDGASIGNFNVIRRVKHLVLGPGATIGDLNVFSGFPYPDGRYASRFEMGQGANVRSRHYFDVAHLIEIGAHTVIAGNGSSFWTHALKTVPTGYEMYPVVVRLGRWVYVGARSTFLGCDVPDGIIIGAGSVVTKRFPPEEYHTLIAGNPAVVRKHYEQKVSVLLPDTATAWEAQAGSHS